MNDVSPIPSTPVAVVGVGAIMPDAPDAATFWANITGGRYSITDVPAERWSRDLYFSADHTEADKTYSTIGGWVSEAPWDPIAWKLPIPPKVADQMDDGQRWAISTARAALVDAGWPDWNVDPDNVAVIIGNAIGGEKHYKTNMRIELPEVLRDLEATPTFAALTSDQREHIVGETRAAFLAHCGEINEDTMPGELANVIAGRVANLFNFRGPNFTTDAACASGLAAMSAAVEGLVDHRFDAAVTGGIDHNMGVAAFVKFCKIGALSATGTRPFDAGADGFVMGEGAALFVLKRLEDAERDGDRVYAVILGIAGASDGKGKGITAPNPVGQRLAVSRAWEVAGVDPATASSIEAHGTSTRVGDATELESLDGVFGAAGAPARGIALGSVKSNIGHLKAAAGSAGMFKMVRSLHDKVLAPSLNFRDPNPNVDWDRVPFAVNTELREWPTPPAGIRRAGVSAFGFGGTNFHVVLEEHVPGRHKPAPRTFATADWTGDTTSPSAAVGAAARDAGGSIADTTKPPLRGALVVGGRDDSDVLTQLEQALAEARAGRAPAPARPDPSIGSQPVRVAIDFADAADLAGKLDKLITALSTHNDALFRMLRQQGVFVGRGAPAKVAFLYTGQGSQYVNMLAGLRDAEPIVADVFRQADDVMTPLLGRSLSSFIFIDGDDPHAVTELEQQLLQTEITQPAVLATDQGITQVLAAYGMQPDMVMGHSLGEYGALVAAGSLTFAAALEAVSARGREMAALSVDDNGAMAAVFGPLPEIERIVADTPGYVVVANINSNNQAVVGGATASVTQAIEQFSAAGMQAVRIPVSHAFHTSIVEPAAVPLVATLRRLDVQPPRIPIVANVTGEFYPSDATSETMLDYLGKQVSSPVQFVRGLHTLYEAGARVFVEVGPKRALHGFVGDVLGDHDDVLALFTNHPKLGDVVSLNQALCGLWASGLGFDVPAPVPAVPPTMAAPVASAPVAPPPTPGADGAAGDDRIMQLGQLFAGVIEQGLRIYSGEPTGTASPAPTAVPGGSGAGGGAVDGAPVVITGAALGLPGVDRVFDDANIARILAGQQFITSVPDDVRQRMADMHITRLMKSDSGGASFETIDDPADVVKLAGRHAPLDVVEQFAVEAARDEALDATTRLAIGAGFDALLDAGIPLVMRYKTTTLGTQLPDRWGLPDALRDDTGVIFASAFPGMNRFAEDIEAYGADRARREQLLALEGIRAQLSGSEPACAEVDRLITGLRDELAANPYQFDRRFLFRVLSMGHSQFAEIIGARGPNTQVNAACASATQALSLAEDWIRAGRCRRVVVVSADDVTGDALLPWIAAGFLASGAAATDEKVEDAATPFDRRRHGMIAGMGAAAFVVESAEAARERGLQPICEVLGAITSNSAFHGTRLDVEHIGAVMEAVVEQAESRGVDRNDIAASTMFVSHETYTPARGGSAAAEVNALRRVFGDAAEHIVVTNTKGFTGHAMGAGIEDVVAIKALETGLVPPVPNYREVDADLGVLNLSRGGAYPVRYALRLAAGFGSQVAMALLRWTPLADGQRRSPDQLGHAYRVVDPVAFQRWLDLLAGHDGARLEVDHRRLRVVDVGAPASVAAPVALPVPYAGRLAVGSTPTPVTPPAVAPPAATPRVDAPAPMVAPPVAESAPAVAAPVAPAVSAGDDVIDAVTGIVAGMTGYPADLLDPDLDLEADLGVDTVKQAEVFAAVREHYELERDDNLQLRDFPTLRHVAAWVRDRTGTTAPPAAAGVSTSAAPAAAALPVSAGDDVVDAVTSIVAEMTGYPADLLDPDLDLEADLGVDTVKQAEVFAAVREHYELERDDNLQLRDFPTLRHVAGWVRERTGTTAPAAAPVAAAPAATAATSVPTSTTGAVGDDVMDAVTSIVAEMTGYPADLLDPDLDLEADLGVDTVKQAEVFAAVREHYELERDDNLQLRDFPTLRHVAGWVRDRTGTTAPAGPAGVDSVPTGAVGDDVMDAVTGIVAEMTGYPADLLDPDLDLEADLGVDTVKQAEVFAAVREHYELERDDNLQLRDFPTLRHVAGWVRNRTGTSAPTSAVASQPGGDGTASREAERAVSPTTVVGDLDAVDALPRRIPVPTLRPTIERCLPTGVALDGARVVVMLDEGGVGDALVKRLAKAGATPLTLEVGIGTDELLTRLGAWLAEGPIAGVYWLPALDDDGDLADYDLDRWRESLRRRVKALYTTMRELFDTSPFLVSATRLGGYHGYDDAGATNPLGGAVVGFTKSYKKERPDALVKAVDLPASRKTTALADLLIDETLSDPGCVEIGLVDGRRFGVGFTVRPFPARADEGDGGEGGEGEDADGATGMVLNAESIVLVTGAAGSIVSAITADLAAASGGTFHLLDLTPTPDPTDPDLVAFRADRDGLKATIAERIKAAGDRPTPVAIERELARYERLDAALTAIQAVEAGGGTAHYHSVDLTDAAAVAAVMADVRERSGRLDVLLHAAGLEISRDLPDKEPREYDLVFDVKSDGWFNVFHGARELPIAATVVFSSVAGRFGNRGQTDYAAANDLLCKITSNLRRTMPDTRGLALDWTAWGGIGMATRGSIPKIMEMAGVEMLPAEAGVAWIRRELTSSDDSGEVIVAGTLGMMAAEPDDTGGIDAAELTRGEHGPMVGTAHVSVHDGILVRTELDPTRQPFLDDHRIDGTPVLPGVMGIEAFAETARLLAPDHHVVGVEDVAFDAPLKFYRDEPRTITVQALVRPDGDGLVADAQLSAERILPGQDEPQRTVHFTGRVRLARDPLPADHQTVPADPTGERLDAQQVYSFYFHGPAYQVVTSAWRDGDQAVARLTDPLPANHDPAELALLASPRLIELCFQTAGLWQAGREGRLALPMQIDAVRLFAAPDDAEVPLSAVARQVGPDRFDCAVVDATGRVLVRLDAYGTVPLPTPIPESVAADLRTTFAE
jgi:acyl transferase domain-containing protein/acyl carrier protein